MRETIGKQLRGNDGAQVALAVGVALVIISIGFAWSMWQQEPSYDPGVPAVADATTTSAPVPVNAPPGAIADAVSAPTPPSSSPDPTTTTHSATTTPPSSTTPTTPLVAAAPIPPAQSSLYHYTARTFGNGTVRYTDQSGRVYSYRTPGGVWSVDAPPGGTVAVGVSDGTNVSCQVFDGSEVVAEDGANGTLARCSG